MWCFSLCVYESHHPTVPLSSTVAPPLAVRYVSSDKFIEIANKHPQYKSMLVHTEDGTAVSDLETKQVSTTLGRTPQATPARGAAEPLMQRSVLCCAGLCCVCFVLQLPQSRFKVVVTPHPRINKVVSLYSGKDNADLNVTREAANSLANL